MLKNYVVIALRKLQRERGFAFVNIVGLALGMAVCLIVVVLIHDQFSYDRFHAKHDRIVRIVADRTSDGDRVGLAATPAYLGPALEADLPFVERSLRLGQIRADIASNGRAFAVEGLAAEPAFFELFDFELLAGDRTTALAGPGKVVLTETTAERLFGDEEPLGRVVEIDGYGGPYTVSGVVRTDGVASHLRFALLASFETLRSEPDWVERLEAEDNFHSFATYLLLQNRASAGALDAVLDDYSRAVGDTRFDLELQPLTSVTLGPAYANEIAAYNLPGLVVWMLSALGVLVMLAAGFNYVGLATAQSVGRAREVGVRKSVGASRRQVAAQFMAESVVVSLMALPVAVALLSIALPAFNRITFLQRLSIDLSLSTLSLPQLVGLFIPFSLIVGFLAGIYPAFRVSGFRPVWVLKGQLGAESGSAGRLRKSLVFIQITIALMVVVTTVLLYRQFEYMVSADLGFNSAEVVTIALQGNDISLVRDELERRAGIGRVAALGRLPAAEGRSQTVVAVEGDTLAAEQMAAGSGALDVLGIPLLAGRDLQDRSGSGFVITQALGRRLGYENDADIVGRPMWTGVTGREPQPIVGVARDFVSDAFEGVHPTFLYYDAEALSRGHAVLRVESGDAPQMLARAQELWPAIDGAHEFEGGIYEELVRGSIPFRVFRDVMRLIGVVAGLALAIGCLGLLAMSAYSTALRTKEIGIRKVLGAGVLNVVWLLSREFLQLLALAAAVGLPLAYILNAMWLEGIAYRVGFGVGTLTMGLGVVTVLVLAAVGSQALRGALKDPVDSLRFE